MPTPLTITLLAACGLCLAFALWVLLRGASYRPVRRKLRLRITHRRDHGIGLFTLVLQRPWYFRVKPLPAFLAGQSVSVSLPGTSLRRRYSLARWKTLPYRYELTVRREEAGKFSRLLTEHATRSASLLLEPPSGKFVLPRQRTARRAVMIAGGVGITPLLAMIDQWRGQNNAFEEVHLYWQVRFEGEWIYRDVLERHSREDKRLRVRWLASRPRQGSPQRIDIDLLKRELGHLADTQYFLCAGQSLLDASIASLMQEGVSPETIHYERFGIPAASEAGTGLVVEYEGVKLHTAGEPTLLALFEAHGISIDADCRAGECGRCAVRIIKGEVRSIQAPTDSLADGHALACCSMPVTNLVLARRGLTTA